MQYETTWDGKKEMKKLLPGNSPCWKDPYQNNGMPVSTLISPYTGIYVVKKMHWYVIPAQTCITGWEAGSDPSNPNIGSITSSGRCDCNIKACGCKVEAVKQCQNQVFLKYTLICCKLSQKCLLFSKNCSRPRAPT